MKHLLFFLIILASLHVNAQISEDGLLAYFPFDGDVLDEGPGNYDGNNFGGSFNEDELGNPNASLELNGINEFVDLSGFADVFRENMPKMSIYFKVKFDNTNDSQTILSLGSAGENLGTNVFEFEYENGGIQIETEIGSAATNFELEIDEPQSFLDNEWHEVLISLVGDSLIYCRDGQVVYSGLYTPAETATTNLFLGGYNGTGNNACCFFGGRIDELQFYNRVLNKEELTVSTSFPAHDDIFDVFPNPTEGNVVLTINDARPDLSLSILDAKGRLLRTRRLEHSTKIEIEFPEPAGIYFLQIIDSAGAYQTHKIIKD